MSLPRPWSRTPVLDNLMDQDISESGSDQSAAEQDGSRAVEPATAQQPPSKKRKLDNIQTVRSFCSKSEFPLSSPLYLKSDVSGPLQAEEHTNGADSFRVVSLFFSAALFLRGLFKR